MDKIPDGYIRVTEVLQPFTDFSDIPPAVLAKAADRGTRAHKFCELYLRNLLLQEVDQDCLGYFKSFVAWRESVVDKIYSTEQRINCPNLKLSGQIDLIVTLKGDTEPMIIDIKTPQSSAKSWRLQSAAYLILARDHINPLISRRACLMLPKDGGQAKFKEYQDEQDEQRFLNALELYTFFKK